MDFTTDIRTLALDRLEDEISELAAHIHAATCRWLELVAELDRREGHRHWGCRSCAEWLSLRCGVALGSAREQVRAARRLDELPLVRAAFAGGRLSYSKVRAVSRVAEPHTEAELVEVALEATAAQLERIVRAYRHGQTVEEANAAHRDRHLSYTWDEDGSLVIRGRLPAGEGELLLKALEAAREATVNVSAETSDEPIEPAQSNADALVSVADASLTAREGGRSGGDRYQVVVHTDATAGNGGVSNGGVFGDGATACPETVERMACDASVVQMSECNGKPVRVGRKTRTISPALRRALRSRDRCCRFPGCSNHRFVDAHHIHHWARGGNTDLSNLVLLCRHHHRLLHEGGYAMAWGGDGTLIFRRPDGRAIRPTSRCECADPRDILRANRRLSPAISAETAWARSRGERYSLDLTVSGLLERAGRGTEESGLEPSGVKPASVSAET